MSGKKYLRYIVLVLMMVVCQADMSFADNQKAANPSAQSQPAAEPASGGDSKTSAEEKLSVTHHSMKLDLRVLNSFPP